MSRPGQDGSTPQEPRGESVTKTSSDQWSVAIPATFAIPATPEPLTRAAEDALTVAAATAGGETAAAARSASARSNAWCTTFDGPLLDAMLDLRWMWRRSVAAPASGSLAAGHHSNNRTFVQSVR